ncbi:hypothetical protein B0H14DRAFT_2748465 [Mycena olivaceomarginata]|nr:hypothetical protein B0H14DRAFT_2748465 [Mycena olivaceomarginata]
MFSTFAVLLATAAAAQAPTPTSPPASATLARPTLRGSIPIRISPTCTSSIRSATAGFAPGGNLTNASKQQVTDTLTTICASSFTASCPQNLITGKLASFQTACSAELVTAPNKQVKVIYDTFYTLLPFLSALCTKDNSGAWCVPQANSTASSALAPNVATTLGRRGDTTAYLPNADTLGKNNVLFLLLQGTLAKDQLCTDCTAAVLKAYMLFEASTNYAPGLAQSPLLIGQPTLYSSVISPDMCGPDFLKSEVKAAGSLGQGSGSSGALPAVRAGGVLALLAAGAGAFLLLL